MRKLIKLKQFELYFGAKSKKYKIKIRTRKRKNEHHKLKAYQIGKGKFEYKLKGYKWYRRIESDKNKLSKIHKKNKQETKNGKSSSTSCINFNRYSTSFYGGACSKSINYTYKTRASMMCILN